MNIVKAEILWTRICSLRCSYCGMADGRVNSLPLHLWFQGVDNLKYLGCGFIAFYGAEPLLDFNLLPKVVGYAEKSGIHTTVISSGVVANFYEKLDILYQEGARSLSMSFDMVDLDKFSELKTSRAVEGLTYFKNKGVRDVAAIATLTSKNYTLYPSMVKRMSELGIWCFFDLIHWDRGQPGSKCRNYDGIKDLLFSKEDIEGLVLVLQKVEKLKEEGFLCHSSKAFLRELTKNNCELIRNYNWNCGDEKDFPAWVTIDCNGLVYCCDDFQPRGSSFLIYDLYNRWEEFGKFWKPIVRKGCSGCCWNTHIDAHLIKRGDLPFSDYVHTEVDK